MKDEYFIMIWMVFSGLAFVLGRQPFMDYIEPNKSAQIFQLGTLMFIWTIISIGIGATITWVTKFLVEASE